MRKQKIELIDYTNKLVNMSDEESVSVEKYSPFTLDFVMTMFFGTQYESINKERILFIGKASV